MRRFRGAVGVAVAAIWLSGCWLQPGFDAGRTNWSPGESELTPTTVGGLAELWATEVAPGVNAPLAVGGSLHVSTSSGSAASLVAATGAVRWQRDDLEWGPRDPAYFDGQILVPTTDLFPARLGMYELATATGQGGPTGQGGAVAVADGVPATLGVSVGSAGALWTISWTYGPLVLDLGFGNPPARGFAIVGDRIQWPVGNAAWGFSPACPPYPPPADQFRCAPDWTTDLGAPLTLPAAVGADGVVYGDGSGTVTVLDTVTGAIRWQAELGAPVNVAPAVADGTILVGTSDGRLVALAAAGCGAATCTPLWEASLSGTPARAPVAAGDVAYVGTTSGTIDAFALAGCAAPTCGPLTTVTAGSPITGGPIIHDGRVIAGTEDGTVVAFGLPD